MQKQEAVVRPVSGALGADTSRRQYIYGVTSEPLPGQPTTTALTERNMQTDNHVFGRILRTTGVPVGAEFGIATTTNSDQINPSVVGLDEGVKRTLDALRRELAAS